MTKAGESPKSKRQARRESDNAETEKWKKEHPFAYQNIPLGEGEKEEIAENPITPQRLAELVLDCTVNSYKVGMSYDWQHRCHVISLTSIKLWREDYNLCVTSRHNDLWVALAIAEYKYFRIIKAGALERSEDEEREIFD